MRLKELRKKHNISQLKLAMDLQLNQNAISRYETGVREADYSTLIKIADYFDCHLVDIANIEGYDYAKYTMDGLHPNEQGMDLITELFVRKLEGVYGLPEKEESK